ncbi:MAG: CzcA family heavy metal efflux pump, partial [Myxococcota bacterium]
MLKRLIAFSLERSGLVLVAAGLIVAWAGIVLTRVPVDVFPELNSPTVVVLTEAGGLSSEEVEQQVTYPIESVMTGLPDVRRVRSASALGLSLIWIEFGWGADIYRARQMVNEKLSVVAEELPESAHPELGPVTSITGEIMLISLSSPNGEVNPLQLRELAEFVVRPRLMAVQGVSQTVAIGGQLPEYQVHVTSDGLLRDGLTLQDVVAAATEAQSTQSGGYLANSGGMEQPLLQQARPRSASDIRASLVETREGAPLTLGAVADVGMGGAPRRGTASAGGKPAVVLSVQKAPGTNTLRVTADVDKAVASIRDALPPGVVLDEHAFRQAEFIQRAVDNVSTVLRDATIIVSIVLLMFLLSWRTTLITLTALPLSLAVALLVMDWLGLSLNVMTLGGLAVAIGELVDDAIIDVENVHRRLRENAALAVEDRHPVIRVVYDASNEIRSSVVFATVIICAVFTPLLFLEGLEGRFFRPLGLAYITSILASLAVALTVTPALCLWLLSGEKAGTGGEGPVPRVLKAIYRPVLAWTMRYKALVLAAVLGMTVVAGMVASGFGAAFLPEFSEGSFTVFLRAPPGTSLDESDRLARGIDTQIRDLEGVRGVVRRTGRAERDEHAEPVWSSELEVTLESDATRDAVRARIDGVLEHVPGITTTIGQPIEHRLSHILSGTPAAIAIKIYGEDLDRLRVVAREMESVLKTVPGARDVAANREQLAPTLPIRYRRAELARHGLTPAAAAEQVSAAFLGAVVARVREGNRVYDLVVRLAPEARVSRRDVERFVLRGQDGQLVRLEDVATVAPASASVIVSREDSRRVAVVSCNVAPGANLGGLVEQIRTLVTPIASRHGVSVSFGGQFEAEQSARATLINYGGIVLLLILGLLATALGSLRAALLVLVNLPLGAIGGVAAVYLAGGSILSVASMVGFITLFGIVVRNGILLVNHYARLQEVEKLPLNQAILLGSEERLIPILMTALTAVLGLLPLALSADQPGSELLGPLAVVVLGGLASSTLLNLFVVPIGYSLMFARKGFVRQRAVALMVFGLLLVAGCQPHDHGHAHDQPARAEEEPKSEGDDHGHGHGHAHGPPVAIGVVTVGGYALEAVRQGAFRPGEDT